MDYSDSIFWNLVRILWKKKYIFLVSIVLVAVITFIVTSLMPKTYKASLTFIVNEKDSGFNISSLIGDLPFDLGGMNANKVDKYIALLKSRRIKDVLIKKYNLKEEYNEEYIELLYKAVDKNIQIHDNMDGTISISCFFKNSPEKAYDMVNTVYNELYKLSLDLNKEKSKNYREFLEKNLNETFAKLALYEDSLKAYQISHKVINFEEQAKFSFAALAELESKGMLYKIEYDVLKENVASGNPKLKEMKERYLSIDAKKQELYRNGDEYILAFEKMPEYGLKYFRLLRGITIQQEILKVLYPIVQNSRIEEKKETVNLQVIDKPFIPQYKTKPKRLTYIIIFVFLTFIIEIMYFSIIQAYKKNKSDLVMWINR